MKTKKIVPEDFLQIRELSQLENESLKGGKALTKKHDVDEHECTRDKCSTHN